MARWSIKLIVVSTKVAIPNTPKPAYPNVPAAPGVPTLPRASSVIGTVSLLAADASSILNFFGPPQWGLFDSTGQPAFANTSVGGILSAIASIVLGGGQSVGDIEYRIDHRISTAPQEQGAFLSYNKVSLPFNGRVTYIVSGTAAQRSAFLGQVLARQASLDLLTLVMPEFSYPSCNIVHHDFRRMAQSGVSMIAVDIWVEEVRVTGTAAYTNTQTPSGSDPVNGGTAQPQPLSAAQQANVSGQESTGAAGGLT